MTKHSYDVVVIGGGHAGCEAAAASARMGVNTAPVSYTHLRAHETSLHLVCRLLLEKKGISLALGKSKEADLNIVVIDNSSKSINNEIKKMIDKDTIILLNKSDLEDEQNHEFDVDTVLASVKKIKTSIV